MVTSTFLGVVSPAAVPGSVEKSMGILTGIFMTRPVAARRRAGEQEDEDEGMSSQGTDCGRQAADRRDQVME
jgi:hypothetical protein